AHRSIGTWHRAVDVFVALTQFQKAKLLAGGVPESRMIIRPNFLSSDPGPGPGDGGYALFAGRLTREKGVLTLLEAWARLPMPVPLRIVGSGPLVEEVRRAAATNRAVSYLGPQPHGRVLELLQRAACLVFPSEWYESFGRIVLEALAVGTPVAAASGGAAEELVRDGSTGALFRPGDPEGLAVAVSRIVQNGEADGAMRTACRREYLEKYTAERAYERLIEIYRMATGHRPDKTE
ncbi:MAG TPA: glycosyltransferase, partial [Acidobacteria bacterium]|nr:glycosyltransferase [Acidobacteriota bacterium]